MKYYIDFTPSDDYYNNKEISLYFDNFEDYIFNLGILIKEKYYKITDCGISWGWTKEDLSEKVNDLIRGVK